MARQPRFFVPNVPLHVIQRGNNRGDIFAHSRDYRFFIDCLFDASHAHDVSIHAYVLMTNHVHLLATPSDAGGMPRVLQSVGRRYVQHFNRNYGRTGTLWEGRYRAAIVDSERYLFTCMRYIELNPVRAGMAKHPGQYPWSSYPANAHGRTDRVVLPHALYEHLGRSEEDRQGAYRELCEMHPDDDEIEAIRRATHKNWALGEAPFLNWIKIVSGRRPTPLRVQSRTAPQPVGTLRGQTRKPWQVSQPKSP